MICTNALRLPYRNKSAHMAACSPPYYQKRRYSGVIPALWPEVSYSPMPGLLPITVPAVTAETIAETPDAGLLGLEPDPLAYIGHLVLIGREVWRVLRDDGVWCVNIGDTYQGGRNGPQGATGQRSDRWFTSVGMGRRSQSGDGYKPKDLMMIPARLALALCADGWTLRSRMPGGFEMRPDLIWTKNAMPESVRDRPSVDFEDVFILSKRKRYCWDQESGRSKYLPCGGQHGGGFQGQEAMRPRGQNGNHLERFYGGSGANLRASWKINTEPTSESHYAAWPRELVRRLISIGTSDRGACEECGAQWERVVERYRTLDGVRRDDLPPIADAGIESRSSSQGFGHWRAASVSKTKGWAPSCECGAAPLALAYATARIGLRELSTRFCALFLAVLQTVPCRVLDPFSGIGRTGEVCHELGRIYMPAELSLGYARLQALRLARHVAVRQGSDSHLREIDPDKTISGPLFD